MVLLILLLIEIFILWQILYALSVDYSNCDNVHYNINFLVKTISSQESIGGFFLQC